MLCWLYIYIYIYIYIYYVQTISQVASTMLDVVDLSIICFHIHISRIFSCVGIVQLFCLYISY